MKTSLDLEVTGERRINCSSCEARIRSALVRLAGVEMVDASAATQRVSVTIETDAISSAELVDALEQLGYRTHQSGK